jgi:UDP-3-O-[3-hydroxymyristoyl] N-acetylglucosamine deacetylase/3-hydroxyacyl-[acyl-carrier-protein] dehydratase
MSEKQKTLAKEFTLTGKGLHTGLQVTLTAKPAPANHGIKFMRIDLEENPIVEASVEHVVDTSRGTTLESKGVRISTIEHMMAAFMAKGIDNVMIEIDAPEAPILDGSAKFYIQSINEVGVVDLPVDRTYYEIKKPIEYVDPTKGIEIIAYPDDHFNITVQVDYNSKVLGPQFATLHNISDFDTEIAPCRTFCFFHEIEALAKHNLIKGGDLDNAIVIVEKHIEQEELDRIAGLFGKEKIVVKEGVLNNLDLQFRNEPARHKLLDVIGDLALIGQPIKGRIIATKPGHLANTEFAKILKGIIKKEFLRPPAPQIDLNATPLYNIQQIRDILPHRPPFLLIDKIMEMDDKQVIGVKNVSMNEPFFVGHFPNEPVMPGVLQIEAAAQCGGILVLNTVPDPQNYSTYFLKIDKVKFKRKVVPGDTLVFKCFLLEPIRRGIAIMGVMAFVGDNLVMESELTAQIVKVKS